MTTNHIGHAERAVYELVERGAIDAAHASLYRRPLLLLAKKGLVRRTEAGGYAPILAATDRASTVPPAQVSTTPPAPVTLAPASEPEREPMGTLVVRVPQHVIDTLDAIGPSRSKAARSVLTRALGSGLRKAVSDVRA